MTTLTAATTDSFTMLRRSIRHTLRSPDTMILAIALPILLLVLFVYVFGGAMNVGTDYLNYVVPGIILLCAGFGASTVATAVSSDMTEGIVDRFRTMAVAQRAILAGHVGASVLRNLVTTTIVVTVAVLMGFRPSASPLEYLAAIGMVALFVLAISWLCVALGLLAANPEAASGFTFFLTVPAVRVERVRAARIDAVLVARLRRASTGHAGHRDVARAAHRHADRQQRLARGVLVHRHRRGRIRVGACDLPP